MSARVCAVVLGLLVLLGGCAKSRPRIADPDETQATPADPGEVEAIRRVIAEDKRIGNEHLPSGHADATVAGASAAVRRCCQELEAISLTDCPTEFRTAYRRHTQAWRDVGAA